MKLRITVAALVAAMGLGCASVAQGAGSGLGGIAAPRSSSGGSVGSSYSGAFEQTAGRAGETRPGAVGMAIGTGRIGGQSVERPPETLAQGGGRDPKWAIGLAPRSPGAGGGYTNKPGARGLEPGTLGGIGM